MSLARTMFKNTFWLGFAQAVQMLLLVLANIFLTRYLGDVNYGKYTFAISFTNLFAVLADFGFTNLLINEVARDKSKLKNYLENIIGLKIVISILFFALMFLIIYFNQKSLEIKILVGISSITVIINSFVTLFYSVFRAYEQMKNEAVIIITLSFINFILVFFAIYKKLTLINFFEINLFVTLIGFFIALALIRHKFLLFSFKRNVVFWKKILKDIIPFLLSSIFINIYFFIDQVMLSFMKGDQVTGWYGAAYRIFSVFIALSAVYFGVFYPVVSRLYTESRNKLELLLRITLKISFIIFLPVSLLIYLLAKPIVLLVFGSSFLGGVVALQIIIWVVLLFFISPVYSNTLLACSQRKYYTIGTFLGTISNVLLNFALIPFFSLNGAAAATLISQFLVFIYMFYMLSKKVIYVNFLQYSIKPILASILMGIVVYVLNNKNINLFIILVIGILIYVCFFAIFKGIKKEDIFFVIKLIKTNQNVKI